MCFQHISQCQPAFQSQAHGISIAGDITETSAVYNTTMSVINETLTALPGLRVGHATDAPHMTGCTVVLCPQQGCVAGVDVRGSAPGTRETDLLRPGQLVERVNAILLTGGSAFGLDAAGGVMRYLEERGTGHPVGMTVVPIVPAAVIFDLAVGDWHVRPDVTMGYAACAAAGDGPVLEGNLGAGTGASVGKIMGMTQAMKAGVGSAAIHLPDGLIVAALMVANALGDVVDPQTGRIIAGARLPGGGWANTAALLLHGPPQAPQATNTVIGVVATNARMDKAQATRIAQLAHDGLARAIRPAHTMFDGDTIFALSAGDMQADISRLGEAAAQVTAAAIVRAVRTAHSAGGLPGLGDG
jgi:L-aminopeptidase/D-esterase-like protein